MVNTDCHRSTELLYEMRREVETKGLFPLQSISPYIYPRLYDSLDQLAEYMAELVQEHNVSRPSLARFHTMKIRSNDMHR